MFIVLTPSQVSALDTKELVAYFNVMAKQLGVTPVNRFASRDKGIQRTKSLTADYVKKFPPRASSMPTLETLGHAARPQPASAKKITAKPASTRNVRRGTNLKPLGTPLEPCREGSKQAILLDMLRHPHGATMDELIDALSGGNKPWTEVTVRSGFGWDLKNKGYGVRSSFDEKGVERFHLVLPEKFTVIPPHTSLKSARPKSHAGQASLGL